MAAWLSLRDCPIGTDLQYRRGSRRDRMEGDVSVSDSGMQDLAFRLLRRPLQVLPAESRDGAGLRALLSDSARIGRAGRVTEAVGSARMSKPRDQDDREARSPESAHGDWIDGGNEPAAGQPAPCSTADRAANDYGIPKLEESISGI